MEIIALDIKEVLLIKPKQFGDNRGFFSETFRVDKLAEAGFARANEFIQDNHSFSAPKYTLRGLHFQSPPFAQDKLLRVTRGSILDVAVDIRANSPTYGQYVSAVLSADNWHQLLVPQGFAHGFLTLEENTEVQYKVTGYYSKEHDHGILWSDSDINIDWGLPSGVTPLLSEKDTQQPLLKDTPKCFEY